MDRVLKTAELGIRDAFIYGAINNAIRLGSKEGLERFLEETKITEATYLVRPYEKNRILIRTDSSFWSTPESTQAPSAKFFSKRLKLDPDSIRINIVSGQIGNKSIGRLAGREIPKMYVVHPHFDGDSRPSPADLYNVLKVTRRLKNPRNRVGIVCGIDSKVVEEKFKGEITQLVSSWGRRRPNIPKREQAVEEIARRLAKGLRVTEVTHIVPSERFSSMDKTSRKAAYKRANKLLKSADRYADIMGTYSGPTTREAANSWLKAKGLSLRELKPTIKLIRAIGEGPNKSRDIFLGGRTPMLRLRTIKVGRRHK